MRLINDEGENVGVVKTQDALRQAYDKELDLVVITESANPPVAKILDFNKFLYEQEKKKASVKAGSRASELKEVRFGASVDDHYIKIKANQARDFLLSGNVVKVTLKMKGRENAYPELSIEKVNKFIKELEDIARTEGDIKRAGSNITAVLIKK